VLKKRVIGCIIVRDGIAVQSIGFRKYLPIGKPEIAAEYLSRWGIDEIALLDISATRAGRVNFEMIRRVSAECQVPLAYGGGLESVDQMVEAVKCGADKIILNQAFYKRPELASEGAEHLGDQCIMVSLDVMRDENGYGIWSYLDGKATPMRLLDAIELAQTMGAGEIFLNSVDRDGSQVGFDTEALALAGEQARIPLIGCGGAGHPKHFADALVIPGVAAVAAANFFHFTEHSVAVLKSYMNRASTIPLRNDCYFNYVESNFENDGRIARKHDATLKELLFEFHPPEVV
jgi:imidazole glycerol-phosphate synthase subunit HisF